MVYDIIYYYVKVGTWRSGSRPWSSGSCFFELYETPGFEIMDVPSSGNHLSRCEPASPGACRQTRAATLRSAHADGMVDYASRAHAHICKKHLDGAGIPDASASHASTARRYGL